MSDAPFGTLYWRGSDQPPRPMGSKVKTGLDVSDLANLAPCIAPELAGTLSICVASFAIPFTLLHMTRDLQQP